MLRFRGRITKIEIIHTARRYDGLHSHAGYLRLRT
jgi:hypothetical protein